MTVPILYGFALTLFLFCSLSSRTKSGLRGVMVYRKGELNPAMIDRNWPHQVALPDYKTRGGEYIRVHDFCRALSLCPRGHTFVRNDQFYSVFCFADAAHAEAFRAEFGGEMIDPKDRPRWGGPER